MLYDQEGSPAVRRTILKVVWFIAIIAVVWLLVWVIFFRHTTSKDKGLHGSNTSQSQSSGTADKSKDKTTNPNGGASTNPGSTPSELANTGAGNTLAVFGVVSTVGTVAYYIRLRKKLTA